MKWLFVLSESLFECSFCKSDVVFFRRIFIDGDFSVIDDAWGKAVVVKRAYIFFSVVTWFVRSGGGIGVDDFFVVFVDSSFHVIHTAVAYFDVAFIEDSVEFMLLREVFVYELEEDSADVMIKDLNCTPWKKVKKLYWRFER